jgi:hypothetical protein
MALAVHERDQCYLVPDDGNVQCWLAGGEAQSCRRLFQHYNVCIDKHGEGMPEIRH